MSHMQHEVTGKQTWIEVETSDGTIWVQGELIGAIRDSRTATHPLSDKERELIVSKLAPYCEGTVQEWESVKGYGARLSAPGYMDCTEWDVFETRAEAQAYLDEEYPEDF